MEKNADPGISDTAFSLVVPSQTLVSDNANSELKENHPLNMLCMFTRCIDEANVISDLNRTWENEDIKLILPFNWNLVVSHNVLTITNEKNQCIRILFRNALKTKVDYEHSNSSKNKNFPSRRTGDSLDKKNDNRNLDLRCMNPHDSATTYKRFLTIASPKNKKHIETFTKETQIKQRHIFSIEEPILLNYVEENEIKQILMYKADSLLDTFGTKHDVKLQNILEYLVSKSVQYNGSPINLVFEPLKLINTLKLKEKVNHGLIHAHSSHAKYNLREESDLNSLPTHKNEQDPNKTLTSNKALITIVSRDRCSIWNVKSPSYNAMTNEVACETSNVEIYRRRDRTAQKRVNIIRLVSSAFKNFFHFYSLLGGHIRSGAVITKTNSNYWLKASGIVKDSQTLSLAESLFIAVAGRKVVLNISDYLRFLIVFARCRKMVVTELVEQMMMRNQEQKQKLKEFRSVTSIEDESIERVLSEDNYLKMTQSMPNLNLSV